MTVTMLDVAGNRLDFLEQVRNYTVTEGEFFSELQMLERASVALIGVDAADKLIGRREGLVGLTLRIESQPFRIIGVLSPKGGGSFGSQDDVIFVPITSAQRRLFGSSAQTSSGAWRVTMITVSAASEKQMNPAMAEITQILRQRHKIIYQQDDFTVISQLAKEPPD